MPNWCATNWVIRGRRDTVNELKNIFNSLKGKPDVEPNDFGKQWLGNLFAALGHDYNTIDVVTDNCRGYIDSNFLAVACWALGKPSEEPFEATDCDNERTVMAFSTITAWSMPKWLYKEFARRGLEVAYRTTDECNSFGYYRNAELLKEYPELVEMYELGGASCDTTEWFYLGQEQQLLEKIKDVTGLSFDLGNIKKEGFDDVLKALEDWQKGDDNKDIYLITFVEDKESI